MTDLGLRRTWVAALFGLMWILIFGAGFYQLIAASKQNALPRIEPPPVPPIVRGRILAADGTPLALSPSPGTRLYPLGAFAGQIVGYTERYRDPESGEWVYGRGLSGVERISELRLARGEDVRLTIDPIVQALAEEALDRGVEKTRAKWGALIVVDARSGAILAAANNPTLDPESPRGRPGQDPRLFNYAFRYLIEPGSTVKPLTAAALLNEGKVSLEEKISVPYRRKVADRWVRDWRWHPVQKLDLAGILAKSSNVGISLLAERLDPKVLYRYFERLHLDDANLLPGFSERPLIKPPSAWGPVEYANASFGQGFAITPLHLAAAFNSLADGRYKPPVIFAGQTEAPTRVFNPGVAERLRRILTQRISPEARIPGYRVAGKTGTAQIAVPGGYDPNRVVALFAGFVPADAPRVTAVVVLYDPEVEKDRRFGAYLAAPVFKELAEGLFSYWGVPPTW